MNGINNNTAIYNIQILLKIMSMIMLIIITIIIIIIYCLRNLLFCGYSKFGRSQIICKLLGDRCSYN